ncbi:HAD family hydrolase [Marinomonas ostreistagni]|uniref:HAD family hydrolase n=1 Tax=Marinomonas ostreistagni TaxID=359209 RepID=UPI00194FD4D8|nr:HAD family phosphatase [Marinomonas ostreistagni]MBM6550359.1 HAD family phosphatase [Marinomonas ostreistagni]
MLNCIFDMDGTLINSEAIWRQTVQEVTGALYGCHVRDEWIQSYTGCTTLTVCKRIAQQFAHEPISAVGLSEQITILMQERSPKAALMPSAKALLEYIDRNGGRLAIASSSSLSVIDRVIAAHDLPISIRASSYEASRSKPHPHVFELAAQRLGVMPHECIAWEDSLNGAISAYSSGAQVIVVPETMQHAEQKFSFASEIHASLAQSLDWLKQRHH